MVAVSPRVIVPAPALRARVRFGACALFCAAFTAGAPVDAETVHVSREQWQAQAALAAPATSEASKAAPLAAPISGHIVLPVLLAPDRALVSVRAPWPATVLGTSGDHGYSIAHVAFARADVAELPAGFDLELTTEPAAFVRPRRPDALAELDVRRDLAGRVVNPEAIGAYALSAVTTPAASGAFKPTASPSLEGSAVRMLILTRESLAPAFQPYADYKTGLGVPTVVRTVEWIQQNQPHGADLAETLRDFLRDAYRYWGVRSVLLGGDTELLPARYATSVYSLEGATVPTDLYYACLDGNWNADGDAQWGEGFVYADNSTDNADLYPELYIGRLPVTTPAHVQTLLAKLQAYGEPAMLDYQNKMAFLAEVIWPAAYKNGDAILKNGADNAERLILQNNLAANHVLTRNYETPQWYPGSTQLSRATGVATMGSGNALITDIGHGFRYSMSLADASASNVHALSLANGPRPFFLHMLNCSAVAFDFPCLAEKFLLNPNGGAVGVIGSAREAYPDNIQAFQEAWFRKVYTEGFTGAAEAMHEARMRYVAQTYEDGAFRWSYLITTYLGDPELTLWTNTPRTVNVAHAPALVQGPRTYTVTVTEGGAPVPGATVCLWKAGDFYATGRTGLSGSVTLSLTSESTGTAKLAVSGAGVKPYRADITVTPLAGPTVRATGVLQIADSGPGATGNGNGALEAGEAALVRFELENTGTMSAQSVTLQAFCTEPALVLGAAIVNAGAIAPGARVWSDPILATVSGAALDQQRVRLDLIVRTVQGYAWNDQLTLDLMQVAPRVQKLTVDDSALGNSDGVPQNNETYDVWVDLKNYGSAELQGATGQLVSLDPDLTVVQAAGTFGAVAHLGVARATFRVRESNVAQTNRALLIVVDARSRTWTFTIEARRPQGTGTVLGDPSAGQGLLTLTWGRSPSADVAGYIVYRGLSNIGPWVRASTDLIRNATYFRDDGLAGGKNYYYSVVAVDSAGNESSRSPGLLVRTNPALLASWPQSLGVESNSSPTVADLDGDGNLEILSGAADHLYAWHPNGTELRDGDGVATTTGVFHSTTANFMPGLATGDLDGDGRDEVVACTFDTKKIYVFEAGGVIRPGWPRSIVSTTHGLWGTPALGDLDLDGRLEVVVLALDGRLYAWHADGSQVRDGDANPATDGVLFQIPGAANWSRGGPSIANVLPADAAPEIVFGTENSRVYVLRADGAVAPGWPRTLGTMIDAAPSIGDIDHDGAFEIAVPCRDGQLYVFRGDGSDQPGWPRALPNQWAALTPSVALADFDGDGKLELVAASTGATVGEGKLYVFDWQGNVRPGWPVDVHMASESSPVVGDLDGNGSMEIIYGGESGDIFGFTSAGVLFPGFPIKVGAEVRATPMLTDVDRDGHIDMLLSGWDQQVYVWTFPGLYVRHRVPWGTLKGNAQRNGVFDYRDATDAPDTPAAPSVRTALYPNVPNPFNPTTTIRFDLGGTTPQHVSLRIFDVRGALVRTLLEQTSPPGRYDVRWDGRDTRGTAVASGVYFYRLDAADLRAQRKMVLVR